MASACLMSDDAENMRLMIILINGITHGFTINGQALVFFGELIVLAL
jgi:hypothetical protein